MPLECRYTPSLISSNYANIALKISNFLCNIITFFHTIIINGFQTAHKPQIIIIISLYTTWLLGVVTCPDTRMYPISDVKYIIPYKASIRALTNGLLLRRQLPRFRGHHKHFLTVYSIKVFLYNTSYPMDN